MKRLYKSVWRWLPYALALVWFLAYNIPLEPYLVILALLVYTDVASHIRGYSDALAFALEELKQRLHGGTK